VSGHFPGFGINTIAKAGLVRPRQPLSIAYQLIDHLLLSPPIIGEATEVSYNEIYVRILWSEHIDNMRPAGHINQ
jgi:hypothetical protein